MNKTYAGIGSRETPAHVLKYMSYLAKILEKAGFVLNTGDAGGADASFRNVVSNKNVYKASHATEQSMLLAKTFIPHWDRLNEYSKKLHGRNPFQVLGKDLNSPVDFCICYTEKGKLIGGTRTCIVICQKYNIPCFNLGNSTDCQKLVDFLSTTYSIEVKILLD